MTRPGLRELKKRRTRDALLRTALELFTTKGFEETTVDEIVEAVDVSQRTFFRHFAGKQETAFAVPEMVEARFMRALRERPPGEPPFVALRGAVLDSWEAMNEAMAELIPVELHIRTYQMIESTPSLVAVHLHRSTELEARAARVLAEREGLDPDDPRPRVATAAFGGVMRAAGRLWATGEDASVASIRATTEEYLDHLGALAEDWHRDP
ncbi:TetR/AcrR family transcriptional regulator [Streptomyces spectabilis]|uniref:AcrR family transcriptional regulator n=1 Tax=Streptomyces spectabilis TaxID=68270 RepID=A0A7W8ERW1_STRST|nr:TetR/AcrR family transcriptional regulator [Streptomyces spectabilis]MBB5103152.1 AcrR family transcriptional regulator [Streptomyces spectabilis]MCI3902345.1 TetR/AcrR family transcriptional regulator [Streptomyces spectabilis]GGV14446.1 TetR family transcriptional regulator [Streptomyces spectabilis]